MNSISTRQRWRRSPQSGTAQKKWEPDVEICIAENTEDALQEDTLAREDLRAYSDGSAVEGGVGGAAVLMKGEEVVREIRFYLGTDKEHTAYDGEQVGMILAVQLLKEEGGGDPYDDGRKLIIRWSPGHNGLLGNKAADEQAKRAAWGDTSEGPDLPKSLRSKAGTPKSLPISKSALKQVHRKIKKDAENIMRHSPRFPALQAIDASAPSKKFAEITERLPRRHSLLLFQLRTGHVPLNKYLHRISKSDTARCPKCQERD
ncbi:hypothetical protein K503DRAFT_853199 [Rhizopogon vinicolor AM-OR11-026]|uniref:Uncharacterized protein n=1 Tax=Rhizopogon vinicolor AM-OR11-026 TaxID=1314800 RepID=A0A1B7NFQ3_9AGAM|nr:hypothetical protein K503DRAFT_853199 [Rhizopogon vinicolor AM-OR11-026]